MVHVYALKKKGIAISKGVRRKRNLRGNELRTYGMFFPRKN